MTMTTIHDPSVDVRKFQEKFNIYLASRPELMSETMAKFRIGFLQEELDEFKEAVSHGDLVKQFDALLDIVYVAVGTANIQGFPWLKGWEEVQRSNMAKENGRGSDFGKRGSIDPVIKPAGWKPPDLKGIIEEASV